MPVVTEDFVEKELKALLKVGGYRSERAVVEHALEVLLASNLSLRLSVAVELYRSGEITFARACELGGIRAETIKEHLSENGIERMIDISKKDVAFETAQIDRFRKLDW